MSDRAPLQLYVYDCPEDQARALLDVLAETGHLAEGWEGDPPDTLRLGELYGDNQATLDTVDNLAAELVERAPGASWVAWSDPAYEWLGTIYYHTPELGLWHADCDAYGGAVFHLPTVRVVLDADEDTRARLLGLPWVDAIDKLREIERTD